MCAEIRFNDEPVALPDYEVEIRFLDDPPEIHFHDEPVALPEYEPEIRFLDGPVEIFFHGERVDLRSHGVPLPPRGSEVEVWFHDEPVALPDIEPSNEAQDFDAIASALASHNLDDVQLAVSWWLTHYGTEHSRDELTRYLAQAVRNGDIDILDYLLHQEVPFTLHQVGIAIRRKSITMLDMFLRYGWDINEPQSWTTPPLLRYLRGNSPCLQVADYSESKHSAFGRRSDKVFPSKRGRSQCQVFFTKHDLFILCYDISLPVNDSVTVRSRRLSPFRPTAALCSSNGKRGPRSCLGTSA